MASDCPETDVSRVESWKRCRLFLLVGFLVLILTWVLPRDYAGAQGLVRVLLLGAGLASTARGVALGYASSGALLLTALNCAVACRAVDPSWDAARFALGLGATVALFGAWIVWLSPTARRVVLSLLVLLHFAALLSAVVVPPAEADELWLARQLFTRFFRPYLEAFYLDNPYTFYAPGPAPEPLLWFRIQYDNGQSRWVRVPNREDCATGLQMTRYLQLAGSAGQVAVAPEDLADLEKKRQQAGDRHDPPIPMLDGSAESQYQEPTTDAKHLLASYARHVAHAYPYPGGPQVTISGIKIYLVIHYTPTAEELSEELDPADPTLYGASFVGDFTADGKLKPAASSGAKPSKGRVERDPFLYWTIPIVRQEDGSITDYVKIHAGDAE